MADEEKQTEQKEKLPKGLLEATRKTITENNGTVIALNDAIGAAKNQKERDALKKVLDKAVSDIGALKASEIEIAKEPVPIKGTGQVQYVVHAGKYGIRKVVL